ncbi:MAG: thiol reductase thioredoxin [Flavobacteriaceae bacterium]|nr:MAG: thiol reductase thioredoxin [Flavobacteriaceae bacterium]PCI35468.1 MAG: thiol reductase thioredoxin [Flavobacteriaceae bacterium]
MKKLLYFLTLIIISNYASAQKTGTPQQINAKRNTKGDLVGIVNKASFSIAPYTSWFSENYAFYTPEPSVINALKKELKGVTIKAFMGTWCVDSKEHTPVFYKIVEAADFDEDNIQMIAVNRSKKTPDNLQKGYNIIRVPTFIFYKKEKEIGRFVEYPRETVEADLLKIVSGAGYKHSYEDN